MTNVADKIRDVFYEYLSYRHEDLEIIEKNLDNGRQAAGLSERVFYKKLLDIAEGWKKRFEKDERFELDRIKMHTVYDYQKENEYYEELRKIDNLYLSMSIDMLRFCEAGKYIYQNCIKDIEFFENMYKRSVIDERTKLEHAIKEKGEPQISKKNCIDHYTKQFEEGRLKKIFDRLIEREFIPQATYYEHFEYAFSDIDKPAGYDGLIWLKSNALCAYFIYEFISNDTDTTPKWEIGKNVFGINNMAQSVYGYISTKRGTPRGSEDIDRILKE